MANTKATVVAAVIYKVTYLTGFSAGHTQTKYTICNSLKSARELAADYRKAKVLSGELSNDLYKVSKVKVVPFKKSVDFDFLAGY